MLKKLIQHPISWMLCTLLLAGFAWGKAKGVITYAVEVCDPNSPTHCIVPDVNGNISVNTSNSGSAGSTTANSTIMITNTYQLALAASASRKGCLFQNQGTHNMSIALNAGGTSPAILAPSQQMYCGGAGIVIGDPIYVTGTAGDAYIIWSQ